MAVSIANQWTAFGGLNEAEILITPTPGNWLIAVITMKTIEKNSPTICVADWARNNWSLAYTTANSTTVTNVGPQLTTQVWVCPYVQYAGWPKLGVYVSYFPCLTFTSVSGAVKLFEVAGMGNNLLTVDSVVIGTASGTTTASVSLPAPTGGVNCLMIGAIGNDSNGVISVGPTPPWNTLGIPTNTSPNALTSTIWMESTTSQSATWTSTISGNWCIVGVAIRTTGIVPAQPNPNWPVVDFQLALGSRITSPVNSLTWTTLPNRLLSFDTQRGYQYELGFVQSSPTDLKLRNDDGVFTPRTGASGSATANGTTTTMLVSSTNGANMTVGDFFKIKTSGGVLKETTAFQITDLSTLTGTTTVTFAKADGTAGGALAATVTGDVYFACTIDLYVPFRIIATWNGIRYPVCSGWIERWPQEWTDPHWGIVQAVAIDTIATLTAADVPVVHGEILTRKPHSYWPLSDAARAAKAQNFGTSTLKLTPTVATAGLGVNGAAQFGVSTQNMQNTGYPWTTGNGVVASIIGDPGSGWQTNGMTAAEQATKGTALVCNAGNDTTFPLYTNGVTITGMSYTTYKWLFDTTSATVDPTIFILRSATGSGAAATHIKYSMQRNPTVLGLTTITVWDKTSHATTITTNPSTTQGVGGMVCWAVAITQTTWKLYENGALSNSGSCNLPAGFGLIDLFGEKDSTSSGQFMQGTLAHVAIFPRALTGDEVGDIFNSMESGEYVYSGTNDSIYRKLAFAGWRGARLGTFTTYTNGTENTPASTVAEKCATLADGEGGRLFADALGVLQFRAKDTAATQTSRATLGDRPDLGEIPYEGDGLKLDFDPTYIYNQVSISDIGVVDANTPAASTSTYVVSDQTSIGQYGLRTLGKTVSFSDGGGYALGMANTYLTKYAYPKLRLATITLSAARRGTTSATVTWPFILGVEVGDLVTFNRRPVGAPMISILCIVLNVKHDISPNQWDTTLILGVA